MGRPPIGEKAMTAAERMRRYRKSNRPPQITDVISRWDLGAGDGAAHRRVEVVSYLRTSEDAAFRRDLRAIGYSERSTYTWLQYRRFRAFEWDIEIIGGKYGRCGISFIADVCKHAGADTQRAIHDLIKERGAAHARRVWKMTKADSIHYGTETI